MYDIMNVMMNIPFTMINAFTKMSGFLFKLPRMFLTLPDKVITQPDGAMVTLDDTDYKRLKETVEWQIGYDKTR
jgi:hypothetical protein